MPVYYGWFLNEADSWKLCDVAKAWLKAAVQIEHFFKDLSHFVNVISPEGSVLCRAYFICCLLNDAVMINGSYILLGVKFD